MVRQPQTPADRWRPRTARRPARGSTRNENNVGRLIGRVNPMMLNELLAIVACAHVVVSRSEGDVMYRSASHARGEKTFGLLKIDNTAPIVAGPIPDRRALAARFGKAQHVGQKSAGADRVIPASAFPVQAANGMLRAECRRRSTPVSFSALSQVRQARDRMPSGSLNERTGYAEALFRRVRARRPFL